MHRTNLRFFSTLLLINLLIYPVFSQAQNNSVKSKKVFTCQNDDAGVKVDSFAQPDGAVDHYISKHMPAGFKLKPGTIEVLENGWVVFTTHKNGQQEASQGGHVLGHVICPPDSWVASGGGTFAGKTCQCNQGYVAYGDSCKRPEDIPAEEPADVDCAKRNPLTKAQSMLKDKATAGLKKIVDEENALLSKDINRAKLVLSPKELDHYGPKFFSGYGHALERLTAIAVKKDPFLNEVIEYIPNAKQGKDGGGPDFRGKGKLPATTEFDVTTAKEAEKKKKSKDEKKCYEFITYDRLTDEYGAPLPL